MDVTMGGGGPNPKPPPGPGGAPITTGNGLGMRRKPLEQTYGKSRVRASSTPKVAKAKIAGPSQPPPGPGPIKPQPPPPIQVPIIASGTKNPAQPGIPAKVKRAKTRMVEEPIHHPIRPKPIAMKHRPPRPIAIVPTTTEVSQAKRYKKAEEEVLGVAPDAEAKPMKPKGRGTKKEPNPSKGYGSMVKPKTVKDPAKSKGYGSKVKKEQIKSPATVFKRVKAKKAENSAPPDPEPDTEVNPKSSKGKSSKPKTIVKGKGYGEKVQKQQVKEHTAVH